MAKQLMSHLVHQERKASTVFSVEGPQTGGQEQFFQNQAPQVENNPFYQQGTLKPFNHNGMFNQNREWMD
ncbi:MAG: hypothetical protein ACLS8J_04340 [Streptococcus salivarius]